MEIMTEFPAGIKFKYEWRKYQARVLGELEAYLSNGSLHVVAPPGSGKTVLGLEVMLRLNRPTLILAPSLAIREQWIDRFRELFLQTDRKPEWISSNIRKPAFVTVCTYQGVHAAYNNLPDEEKNGDAPASKTNIARELKRLGVKTVILDEAHHLKNEWWYTLERLKSHLSPVIVGLTATPPYDVTFAEWQRYLELNGTVDTEITVPELIREGDLCPHQDYVYYSLPSPEEYDRINAFRRDVDTLFRELQKDPVLIEAFANHPAWVDPAGHLEWIFDHMSFYSAMLIFLHHVGKEIPPVHLQVLGQENIRVPALDYAWMEVLLEFYLQGGRDTFIGREEHQVSLKNKLVRNGVTEKKQISFRYNGRLTRMLTASISKLNSIADIVSFESRQLGDRLRMVILTDYIRKEWKVASPANDLSLDKMGVFPVFEKLRRSGTGGNRVGVLTGSIVVVPRAALGVLDEVMREMRLGKASVKPLPYDDSYAEVALTGTIKDEITRVVTCMFERGAIEILIGTKSLLGEGWDAPCINTLILASFVGSFVLSNQMRGRAIRVEKGNVVKTGNIWHLVCADPTSPTGGDDVELLRRRFKGFLGISDREGEKIENGVKRLDIPATLCDREIIERRNQRTFEEAGGRERLRGRWDAAVRQGVHLVEEIKVPYPEKEKFQVVKRLYLQKTLKYLFVELGFIVSSVLNVMFYDFARMSSRIHSSRMLFTVLLVFLAVGFCVILPPAVKALRLYLKYRDISKDIRKIGCALLRTLQDEKVILSPPGEVSVEAYGDDSGAVYCHLKGGSNYEKSVFINALKEIISPVDNPRYVIVRESRLWSRLKQEDYHAVPELLGKRKASAECLRRHWEEEVGACRLVFTRTLEGRKFLLHCRVNSLATKLSDDIEHVNVWR